MGTKPPPGCRFKWLLRIGALCWGFPALAQAPATEAKSATVDPPRRATVVPSASFRAGDFHHLFFGDTWRALWVKPVSVKVLDLANTAGGLHAVDRGEAHASRPFLLVSPDGKAFGFRALIKDATLDWPEESQTETLRNLALDQVSGTVPGGALVASVIERAAGVPSLEVELVVLPDDPRLGKWRASFAGKLGILEKRLRPADPEMAPSGGREALTSDSLFQILQVDGRNEVDERTFLTSRLVDILVGDWDRHGSQWTWVDRERGGRRVWTAVSSDRDWAFNNLDGLGWIVIRKAIPKYQVFDKKISGLRGLLLMSQPLDRRLLAGLDRSAWDSVTKTVVERLPDRVFARAVDALPSGMDSTAVMRLETTLRARRDHLSEASAAFYKRLAQVVEVWATEGSDEVRLADAPDGGVELKLKRGEGPGTSLSRVFDPEETREVRVYLRGGDDRVTGQWSGGPVTVRIVHEGDGTLKVDSTVSGVRVYDSKKPFPLPGKRFDPGEIFRDWGGSVGFSPWIGQKSGAGIIVGGGPVVTKYGFRRVPYAYKATLRAAYGTTGSTINVQFKGDFRFARPGAGLRVDAKALQADALHYFGIGNETSRPEIGDFYLMRQHTYLVDLSLYQEFAKGGLISFGPVLSRTVSDLGRPTLALEEQPYGFGTFTELGAGGGVLIDLRDDPIYPVTGLKAQVNGRFFPAIGDVNKAFGVVAGELAGYLGTRSIPGTPVLAVRAGGAKGFGNVPFFEAPKLGGKPSLRGFSRERFNGDRSLYGSAELRFRLGQFKAFLPGEFGVYGLGDIGRVYLKRRDLLALAQELRRGALAQLLRTKNHRQHHLGPQRRRE